MFGFGMPGIGEILIILFVVLLLFGGKKLPEFARSLGSMIVEFKRGKNEINKGLQEINKEISKEIRDISKDIDISI